MTLSGPVEVVTNGEACVVRLRPPRYGEVVESIDPVRCAKDPRSALVAELEQIVVLDGIHDPDVDVDAIVDDESALTGLLRERQRLYESLIEQGRVEAVCPHCSSPVELDLVFFSVGLGLPSWRALNGMAIAVPALADPEPPSPSPLRPYDEPPVALRGIAPRTGAVPLAARIDVVLPSARVRLASAGDAVRGTIGDVDARREGEAWKRWAPAGRFQPVERLHWDRAQPGFRAALRLSVALESLTTEAGERIDATPESIERLFLCDVQFLDLVYSATHNLRVDESPDGRPPKAAIDCRCGQRFLPVR